ncbi:hypothetical protein L9F63_014628, partial [Diploptera punctata]
SSEHNMTGTMELVLWWIKLISEITFALMCLVFELCKKVYYVVHKRKLKDVRGKTVLITGTAQGIGREMALELAKKGCNVICVDVLTKENEETAEEVKKLGQKSFSYTCDISNRDNVMKLASQVGKVDILINNAGLVFFDPLLETPPGVITRLIDVNVTSHFWMIQAFLPGMLERREGHIVAIASLAGIEGLAGATLYSVSKQAVVGLMRTLDLELRSKSQQFIKTTCVCPYFIDTMKDVKFRIESRLSHLETKEAAYRIVKGVLKELPEVIVPGYWSSLITFN